MFGLGITEILVVLIVALLVLGPEKLPEVARKLGKLSYQLRGALDEIKHEMDFSDGPPDRSRAKNTMLISSSIAESQKSCCEDEEMNNKQKEPEEAETKEDSPKNTSTKKLND